MRGPRTQAGDGGAATPAGLPLGRPHHGHGHVCVKDVYIRIFVIEDPEDELNVLTLVLVA